MAGWAAGLFARVVHWGLWLYRWTDPLIRWVQYCDYADGTLWEPVTHDRLPPPAPDALRVVCISDTHLAHRRLPTLPPGDLLIHAGDIDWLGYGPGALGEGVLADFASWLARQPFPHKVVIPGNHDMWCEAHGAAAAQRVLDAAGGGSPVHFLLDAEALLRIRGAAVRVFGSPPSLLHARSRNAAFSVRTEEELACHWAKRVPDDGVDILVTHQPPISPLLADVLSAKRPRLHVCGHEHEARGPLRLPSGVLSINAATVGERYRPRHPPIVVDLPLATLGPPGP